MAESPESYTIRLLQEMRQELRDLRSDMNARFDFVDERFDDVNGRIDGLTQVTMMLARNAYTHEERIAALEGETS